MRSGRGHTIDAIFFQVKKRQEKGMLFFANFLKEHFNLCFGKARPKIDGKRVFVMVQQGGFVSIKSH